jgi:hypothetical protein
MPQAYRNLQGTDLFANSYGYINGSDEALRGQFSGASEPTNPIPFQCWADTTANRLKMRNAANDGWIDLGDLGQNFLNALPRSGGVMTGGIDMGGQTITNLGSGSGTAAARQQEVDAKAPIDAPQLTGDAQVNQDPAGNNSLTRRSWTEGRYMKLSGGTFTGPVVLSGPGTAPLHPVTYDQLRTFVEFNLTTGHRHNGSDARKVMGTELDAAGSSDKQVLRSTGAGTAPAWSSLAVAAAFKDPPDSVINVDTGNGFLSTTYQAVDLTALTSADAYAAILNVFMTNNGFTFSPPTLRFRKTGSSNDSAGTGVGPIAQDAYQTVVVPLDAGQSFDWRSVNGASGKGVLTVYLIGYLKPAI